MPENVNKEAKMTIDKLGLQALRLIQAEKEIFGEDCRVAANLVLPPDESERLCEGLADQGYLERIGGKKKYRLTKEGEKTLTSI